MRTLILTTQTPFVRGGAEILADELRHALTGAGHEAEIVRFPFKWYPAEAIPGQVLAARLMDVSQFSGIDIDVAIGLKFPAYLIPHPNRVLWLVHQHRAAYDMWDSGVSDLLHLPGGRNVRDFVRQSDELGIPSSKAVFTISRNVSERLMRFNGIESEPVYHPPANAHQFVRGEFEDYLLFPSRLDPMKRQSLVIDALAHTRTPVKVVFVGTADNPSLKDELVARARNKGVSSRIEWTGAIDEATKIRLYAGATAVVYPPRDEDYGYVTLEAMLAEKPVITCLDSGGPLEFITDRLNGFVTEPSDRAVAAAMDSLWDDRHLARCLGESARQTYADLDVSWQNVLARLLGTSPAGNPAAREALPILSESLSNPA